MFVVHYLLAGSSRFRFCVDQQIRSFILVFVCFILFAVTISFFSPILGQKDNIKSLICLRTPPQTGSCAGCFHAVDFVI